MVYSILNIVLIIGVLVGFATLVTVAKQNASESQNILMITCGCAFVSILSYTLEINTTSLEAAKVAIKFGYLGKSFVMLFFLMFLASYCKANIPKGIFALLFIFNTALLGIIMTFERHELYYKNVRWTEEGLFAHTAFDRGICYWMFMAVMVCLLLWYVILSFYEMVRRRGIERKRLILLTVAGFVPACFLVLYLLGVLSNFDPVPLGIVTSCALITTNVVKYGLLDTMQLVKEQIIENTSEGLIVVDNNENLLFANAMAKQIIPALEGGADSGLIKSLFSNQKRETVINAGGRNYEIRISQITDESHSGDIRGYVAWILDMTFVNEYAEEMIRLRHEAEKATIAKSSFLAHMSHEIRTPMNAIIGFSDLCLKLEPEGQLSEYVENIRESSKTLLNLINEILDISKIESGKMQLVDIEYSMKSLVREVISEVLPQAEAKNLTLRFRMERGMPSQLKGDGMRVKEIMLNLLSNALKYTREGYILLKLREAERKEGKVLLEITVKDTGIGIKEEDKERIFRKFEQTDGQKNYGVEGTGLGLAIVKSMAEMMDGSVEVESTYGKGSLFRVRIWQEILDEKTSEEYSGSNDEDAKDMLGQLKDSLSENKEEKKSLHFKDMTVLVVDDNLVNLRVASGLLKYYGIQVDVASSGKESLKLIKDKNYNIVFLDQMMPEMDGVETLKNIRNMGESYHDLPVVALTANAIVGVREEMLSLGFDDYLSKPIELPDLEEILIKFGNPDDEPSKEEAQDTKREEKGIDPEFSGLLAAGFDVDAGLRICGDKEAYKEILNVYRESAPDQQEKLLRALNEEDFERYTILIHALKSASASIGANDISKLALAHEKAGKAGDHQYIRDEFHTFMEEYKKVIKVLEESHF